MAGHGSRFAKKGYKLPKPIIDVKGHPMISYVISNLTPTIDHKFIFVCQNEHIEDYNLAEQLKYFTHGKCEVISISEVTEGAACTTLLAKSLYNDANPLLIANSDQWVNFDINKTLAKINLEHDGAILTFHSNETKWSYASLDNAGFVNAVKEKEVISEFATTGLYYFAKGYEYIRYSEKMIEANDRTKNEFYVAPVYNYFIQDHKKISVINVDDFGKCMYGLGTPDDLTSFINDDISELALERVETHLKSATDQKAS